MYVLTTASPPRRRLLACVLPAMMLPFLASLLYYVLLAGSVMATCIYAATKVFTVVWPVVAAVGIEGARLRRGSIDLRRQLAALPMGVLTGLAIGGIIVGGYALTPIGEYVQRHTSDIQTKVNQVGIHTPVRYVIFCTFLAGLHSLIEEFFWRWYVFGRLARVWPPAAAYTLANLAFAGHHYVVLACYFSGMGAFVFGTCVGVGGALWCWLYRRQKTLAGAWISHALVDAAIFCVGYQLVFG